MSSNTSSPSMSSGDLRAKQHASCTTKPRRRMACDRCHEQKLRCLRTVNPKAGSDCDRCLRLSAQCIYSPPSRMGRPSRFDTGPRAQKARNRRRSGQKQDTRTEKQELLIPTPVGLADIPIPDFLPDFPLATDLETPFTGDIDLTAHIFEPDLFTKLESGYQTPEFTQEDWESDYASPNTGTSAGTTAGEDSGISDARDGQMLQLFNLAHSQYELLRKLERMRKHISEEQQIIFSRLHEYPVREMLGNAQRLIELVDAFSSPSSSVRDDDLVSWSDFTTLNDDFSIADTMTVSASGSSPDSAISAAFSDAPPPSIASDWTPNADIKGYSFPEAEKACMDTPTALLVLSCYLRIARTFHLFFTDLRTFLLPGPAPTGNFRLFPNLKLGSFQPFAGVVLEVSLVVQVIEHVLERLHKALNLPTASDMDASESGLNCQTQMPWDATKSITPALFRAVQVQERWDTGKEEGDTFTQLSATINSVKQLLRSSQL